MRRIEVEITVNIRGWYPHMIKASLYDEKSISPVVYTHEAVMLDSIVKLYLILIEQYVMPNGKIALLLALEAYIM